MSAPQLVKGSYVDVLIEDPNTPGTYIPICGLTTRTFTHGTQSRDRYVRDCADPEDIPKRRKIITGEQWDITGSGVYNRAQVALINAAFGETRNYRFRVDEPSTESVYASYWQGPAIMTQKELAGPDNDDAGWTITIASDGVWTETTF